MRRSRLAAVSVLLAVSAVAAPVAHGAPATMSGQRTETPVISTSPVTDVVESVVTVRIPLPASAGARPESCDWVSYLRWRHSAGPSDAADADKILIAQPGIFEGAGAFDSVARNTVSAAGRRGAHIEFWALDRRSNCLEDHTGMRAGLAAADHRVAIDYYYRGREADGRTFAGYVANGDADAAWLSQLGVAQTVRDQYDLMRHELPDPTLRRQKAFCGGHSLGGFLTGYFAVWDFDANPATTDDAGYNQCAGYFALDSLVRAGMPESAQRQLLPGNVLDGGESTPILALPAVINPETMSLLGMAGLAAHTNPHGLSDLVTYTPSNVNIELTQRMLFSRDLANFVTGIPSTRDFNLTNQVAMAALLDNNSQPLAFLQASVGFFDGGAIADKDFPLPHEIVQIPELADLRNMLGSDRKAIPTDFGFPPKTGPTYTWRNYDRIGAPDDPGYQSRDGSLFTTAAKEVTDAGELARSLSEAPLDFTEWYFPSKLANDSNEPDEEMTRHAMHANGIAVRPVLTLLGGSGLSFTPAEEIQPPPVIAPGYHHLDVLTAAPAQHDGQPEVVSSNLVDFVLRH